MARQLSELRRLQRNQLIKINKEELIESILASGKDDEGLAGITRKIDLVMTELDSLKALVISPESAINKKIAVLENKLEKQAEFISKQQFFMEALDCKERESNLVILGVPDGENAFDGAVSDDTKLEKIWTQIGVEGIAATHHRLGERNDQRSQLLLVTLQDKSMCGRILDRAKNLKTSGNLFRKIFIKRDVHPAVRKEWERLRNAERIEKERPENIGCMIRFDTHERKLYRDDTVVDSWSPQGF